MNKVVSNILGNRYSERYEKRTHKTKRPLSEFGSEDFIESEQGLADDAFDRGNLSAEQYGKITDKNNKLMEELRKNRLKKRK